MRIAYVAMTRPRKLLVIAMPKSTANLAARFSKNTWDYANQELKKVLKNTAT